MTKFEFNKNILLPALIVLFFIGAGIFVFIIYRSYLWSAVIALIIYISTREYHEWIKKVLPKRLVGFSHWVMLFLVVFIIFGPCIFIIRTLISEALSLIFILKAGFSEEKIISTLMSLTFVTDYFTDTEFFWVTLPDTYKEIVGSYGDVFNIDSLFGILTNVSSIIKGSIELPLGIMMNMILTMLLLFFLYKDGGLIEGFLNRHLPFSGEIEEKIGQKTQEAVRAVIKGNLLISILQGSIVGLILYSVGISNPFFYGSIASIFSLIPIIGTMVIWLPAGLYIWFFENNWILGMSVMVGCLLSYLILENFIKPKILDKKLRLHPFLLFLSLLGGIKEFGIMGLVIGPIAVTLLVIIWDFWKMYRDKELVFQDTPKN